MDGLELSPETLAALQSFRLQSNSSSLSQGIKQTNFTLQTEKNQEKEEEEIPRKEFKVEFEEEENKKYKLKEYWNDRFTTEPSYDWLVTYSQIKSFLSKYLSRNSKILVIGCGNSSFSTELYDDGYYNIINIDFSNVVIEKMKELNKHREQMKWIEMNMCELEFQSNSFDLIIDKATMDALLVDEGSVWDPNEEVILSIHKMCSEMSRVLIPNGIFLQISFSQPHFRTKYLMCEHFQQRVTNPYSPSLGYCENYQWNVSVERITCENGCLDTFLYVMTKEGECVKGREEGGEKKEGKEENENIDKV